MVLWWDIKTSNIEYYDILYSADRTKIFFAVVDCQLSAWSEWSSCDRSCGKGVQSRTRVIVQHPSPGKPPCGSLDQKRGCLGTRCSRKDRKYKSPIRGKPPTRTIGCFLYFNCLQKLFSYPPLYGVKLL